MIFVLDVSSSISENDYEQMRNGVAGYIRNYADADTNIGVFQFATTTENELHLGNNLTTLEVAELVMGMTKIEGATFTLRAVL